jgi:hypothetical protein
MQNTAFAEKKLGERMQTLEGKENEYVSSENA